MKLLLKHKYVHPNAAKGSPTPLGLAAEAGHTMVVKELLSHSKLNVNKAHFGGTALMAAVQKGHVEVVDLILRDSRAQPDSEDCDRQTALQTDKKKKKKKREDDTTKQCSGSSYNMFKHGLKVRQVICMH